MKLQIRLSFKMKLLLTMAFMSLVYIATTMLLLGRAPASGPALSSTDHLLALGGVTLVLAVFATVAVRVLTAPIDRLHGTVRKIADGDLQVRAAIHSGDELEDIGRSIDDLLSTRVNALVDIENENEQLNDSIVALLETVARLAQKDLTAKALTTTDLTGPIADALNMMAAETSGVLAEVTRISASVAEASNLVKTQADNIVVQARKEREEVEHAKRELALASDSMTKVARLAMASSQAADEAIKTTRTARSTVTDTVAAIDRFRDGIREAEKRIKKLGERSQEISGVVSLINNISERTQILALNASMHSAAAGDAGRGFGVVADEVQRLAENTREATTDIATLVGNIQTETSTVSTAMNALIAQVVAGSRMAGQAGEQMRATEESTAKLVDMVQKISAAAVAQTRTNRRIQDRTAVILQSVSKTGTHLLEQSEYTDQLLEHAMALVQAVGVFKLPADSESMAH